ncbi:MAG: hypothetical protein KA248_15280 [Kiritimatiellae bacterium]|nr:hypothetical protein [Kiritimatiellia bacterium]
MRSIGKLAAILGLFCLANMALTSLLVGVKYRPFSWLTVASADENLYPFLADPAVSGTSQVSFHVVATNTMTVELQYKTSLMDETWQVLQTYQIEPGEENVLEDELPENCPSRFYRLHVK